MSDFLQGLQTFFGGGPEKNAYLRMMIGWEAQLWLRHCLEGGVLEDPAVDYLAERWTGWMPPPCWKPWG